MFLKNKGFCQIFLLVYITYGSVLIAKTETLTERRFSPTCDKMTRAGSVVSVLFYCMTHAIDKARPVGVVMELLLRHPQVFVPQHTQIFRN